jgi:hypothetical protein
MPKIHPIALLVIAFFVVNIVLLVAGSPLLLIDSLVTLEIKNLVLKLIAGVGVVVMLLSYVAFYANNNNSKTA